MAKRTSKTKKKKAPKAASVKAKAPSKKAKTSKKKKAAKKKPAGDKEITLDRRRKDRRGKKADDSAPDSKLDSKPAVKLKPRAKVNRRRQIDPTTCERDYTDQEVAFMNAMDDYKRNNGRMFPTCSEVLEVIRNLGYVQLTEAELALRQPAAPPETALIASVETDEFAESVTSDIPGDSGDDSPELAGMLAGELDDF